VSADDPQFALGGAGAPSAASGQRHPSPTSVVAAAGASSAPAATASKRRTPEQEAAEGWLRSLVRERANTVGPEDASTKEAASELVKMLQKLDEPEEAAALCERFGLPALA